MSDNQQVEKRLRFVCPYCRARYAIAAERLKDVVDPSYKCKRCGGIFKEGDEPHPRRAPSWTGGAVGAALALALCIAAAGAFKFGVLEQRPQAAPRELSPVLPLTPAPVAVQADTAPAAELPPLQTAVLGEDEAGAARASLRQEQPSPAAETTLAAYSGGAVKFTLSGFPEEARLALTVAPRSRGGKTPPLSFLELADPPRAVIDIAAVQGARAPALQPNRFVKRLRVGRHPGKTRLVLDLAENIRVEQIEPPTGYSLGLRLTAAE